MGMSVELNPLPVLKIYGRRGESGPEPTSREGHSNLELDFVEVVGSGFIAAAYLRLL